MENRERRESGQGYWNVLEEALLGAIARNCEKSPVRHREK